MIVYNIFKSQCADFGRALDIVLKKVDKNTVPVRLVFFGKPADNDIYRRHLELINKAIKTRWGAKSPVFSYIAQHPLSSELTLEVQMADELFANNMRYSVAAGVRYIVIDMPNSKLLFTGGVQARDIDEPIKKQSKEVLASIGAVLKAESLPVESIVRQWNYIEDITKCDGENQNYQDFNDARSHFYADAKWEEGYPAATGIGTSAGGLMVEIDATSFNNKKSRAVSLDNSLQIAAHEYSQDVLVGAPDLHFNQRTTPKFERAKAIVVDEQTKIIYISGTAAIRGEESLANVGIQQQTVTTLENIEFLVSKKNLKAHKVNVKSEPVIQIFRVYLKSYKDLNPARDIITERYPGLPVMYVISDVCRDELLIEIEGIAN